MCGPLLKRGKTLGHWKLRYYILTVDGELTCYRRKTDLDEARPPMYVTQLSDLRVTMLQADRLEAEASASGVFGFRLDGANDYVSLAPQLIGGPHLDRPHTSPGPGHITVNIYVCAFVHRSHPHHPWPLTLLRRPAHPQRVGSARPARGAR